jgi:hypothetical protein
MYRYSPQIHSVPVFSDVEWKSGSMKPKRRTVETLWRVCFPRRCLSGPTPVSLLGAEETWVTTSVSINRSWRPLLLGKQSTK